MMICLRSLRYVCDWVSGDLSLYAIYRLIGILQYHIYLSEDHILESDAKEILQGQAGSDVHDQHVQRRQAQVYLGDKEGSTKHGNQQTHYDQGYTYEQMMLGDQRYLCQIPHVELGDNTTAQGQETNKTDEKTELARATDRGLELLHEMEDKCLYYISGWWSYSFCYNKQIKQFHALPSGSGIPTYPPIEDSTTHSFVLGRFSRDDDDDLDTEKKTTTDLAELQTKGGTRYLVQRLGGGTRCDLTGRERRVEVQFHCHPQSTDRIGWIKELTTCSYLMVIYTPRLCNDVAFLPPQQEEVHAIECREVILPDDVLEWEKTQEYQKLQNLVDSVETELPIVGGIEVGAQKLVGKEGKQIEKGRVASAGEERVEVVARSENGEVQRLSKEELKKYDLDAEKVEQLRKRLEDLANGKDWTLEVVESNGELGLRGIVDTDDEDDTQGSDGKDEQEDKTEEARVEKETQATQAPPEQQKQQQKDQEAQQGKAEPRREEPMSAADDKMEEGSEEVYKDEL